MMAVSPDVASLHVTVLDLIAGALNLERSLLTPDLSIEELGLDSLDVLKLTYAVEQRFRINLSAYSHADISSVERLLDLVALEMRAQGVN